MCRPLNATPAAFSSRSSWGRRCSPPRVQRRLPPPSPPLLPHTPSPRELVSQSRPLQTPHPAHPLFPCVLPTHADCRANVPVTDDHGRAYLSAHRVHPPLVRRAGHERQEYAPLCSNLQLATGTRCVPHAHRCGPTLAEERVLDKLALLETILLQVQLLPACRAAFELVRNRNSGGGQSAAEALATTGGYLAYAMIAILGSYVAKYAIPPPHTTASTMTFILSHRFEGISSTLRKLQAATYRCHFYCARTRLSSQVRHLHCVAVRP